MTGSTRSSDGLDDRRKRLLFRCWHRGTREMDLILGRFADAAIADLTDAEVGQLEQLIEVSDPDLYAALSGDALLAPEANDPAIDAQGIETVAIDETSPVSIRPIGTWRSKNFLAPSRSVRCVVPTICSRPSNNCVSTKPGHTALTVIQN